MYLQCWIHSTSYKEFHLSFHNKLVCFIHKPRFPLVSNWQRNYFALFFKKKKEKWIRVPCCSVQCISVYITRFLYLQNLFFCPLFPFFDTCKLGAASPYCSSASSSLMSLFMEEIYTINAHFLQY